MTSKSASTTDTRLDAIETAEGRAIYPFGAWGAGYLVDDATERRLRAFLRFPTLIVVGFLTLKDLVQHFIMPIREFPAVVATVGAMWLFHYAVAKAILRGSVRSCYRPSSEELLRLRLARGGRTAMVAAHVCGLVACGAIAIGVGIVTDGLERWVVEAICAGSLVLLVVGLRRVQRIPD